MPPSPDVALARLYASRYNRLRTASGVSVGRLWDGVAGLDDEAQERFASVAAGMSTSAQIQTAAVVDGYVGMMLGIVEGDGTATGIDPTSVSGAAVRNGTDPLDVYRRGVVSARVAISEGRSFADAMGIGRDRVVSAAETDVALAQRASIVQVASSTDRVVGYRRVLSGQSCSLCATASAQRYHAEVLMPIHNHCDCGVAPIIGNADPGHTINQQLVSDLKAAGNASGDPDYWRSRRITVAEDGTVTLPDVTIRQHGELGPVLTRAGDDFTGPSDIAA